MHEPTISVLGPVAIHQADGRPLPLPRQRREIVAALAAHGGAVVPSHQLVHAIWGDDTPTTRNRLKSQIAQLRPVLGGGLRIDHHADGYRLVGPLDAVDAVRFERWIDGARDLPPAEAAVRYAEALGLWRSDDPFGGVSNPLVDPATWRLISLRDRAVLGLADSDLACVRPSRATEHLERMFGEDPTRGDVAGRLAALCALASRHVDGLRVVQRHRDALAEIGAVISPEVAALESRILRHDLVPSPAPSRPVGAPTGRTPTVWLPRHRWITRIEEAAQRGPVLVTGEAGVGVTSLVDVVAQRHLAGGDAVVRTAVRADPVRPMHVLLDVLDQLQHLLPDRLAHSLARPGAMAALARASGGATRAAGHVTSRDELIDDLAELVADALDGTGALLVVEDAHWLDSTSAEVIAALLARGRPGTIVATRTPAPDRLAVDGTTVVDIPPFTLGEVQRLLRQALPHRADEQVATHVLAQTGGNAAFVRLAIEVLSQGPADDDLQRVALPATVCDAVGARLSGLSRNAHEALQLAALLGHAFELAPLRLLRPRALESLGEAEADGLVRLDDVRGVFVHGLTADVLVDAIPDGARIALHDELCRAMVTVGAPPLAVAIHAVGAASLDPRRAADACRDAAAQQATVFEWGETVVWARRGLAIVEQYGLDGSRVEAELRALSGTALRRTGLLDSDTELLRAAELAEQWDDDDLLVRVVTELCLHGRTSRVGAVDPRARRHLDRALAAEGHDDVARVELLAAAATLLGHSDEAARARHHYLEARSMALATGDDHLVRSVLLNAHLGLAHPDDLPLRRHAAATLATTDDVEAQWESDFLHVGIGLIDADRSLVERSVRRLRDLTPAVRARGRQYGLLQVESAYAHLSGRLDAAEQAANRAFALGLEMFSESWAMSVYSALLLPIREAQRREAELSEPVTALLRTQPDFITWQALSCTLAMSRRDRPAARRMLAVLRERDFAFAQDLTFTAIATLVCRAVWYLGDTAAAERLLEVLTPYAGQMTWNGLATHGPVDAGLAALAATLGRTEQCEQHRLTARMLVAQMAAPHLLWPEFDELL